MPRRARESPRIRPRRPGDEFASYVADMLAPLGPVQVGRLFSGHGFKLDGMQFAMILRGTLYLRVDDSLAEELSALGSQPFSYQTERHSMTIRSYYAVPPDRLDAPDQLLAWARRACQAALAKPNRRKKPARV